MHTPVGCAAGQARQAVHVQTGFMPAPHVQTVSVVAPVYVHAASPAVHALSLSGGGIGQPAVPPLLLLVPPPLLLAVLPLLLAVPPLLLAVPPLLLAVPPLLLAVLPLLLAVLPLLLAAPPLLLAALPLLLALPSSPVLLALVAPPHPGATATKPPADMETRKRILMALMEETSEKSAPVR
jgi:hypothetical protein